MFLINLPMKFSLIEKAARAAKEEGMEETEGELTHSN